MGNRLSRHILVVGSGIIGLCTSYYALRKGFQVTLVDEGDEDTPNCSTGNAGMIVPSHFQPLAAPGMVGMGLKMMFNPRSPFAFRMPPSIDQLLWSLQFMRHANAQHVANSEIILRDLNLTSRSLYEGLTEDLGIGYQLVKRGLVMICQRAETLEAESHLAKRANELGVKASILNFDELQRLDPSITMNAIGGVHFHDDCHLSPHLLVAELRRRLKAEGADTRYRCKVSSLKQVQDKVVVETSQGSIDADQVVLAGGVFTKDLAKSIGLKLPMMGGKGYSMIVENPVETPDLCSLLIEARIAVTPMQNGVRFGGTMELGEPSTNFNQQRIQGIIDSIPQYFPKFKVSDFDGLPKWQGLRPCSPDGLPYIGRVKTHPNVVIASGHSMMGLSLGPVTGMLVSEILGNESSSLPLEQLDPNRYV